MKQDVPYHSGWLSARTSLPASQPRDARTTGQTPPRWGSRVPGAKSFEKKVGSSKFKAGGCWTRRRAVVAVDAKRAEVRNLDDIVALFRPFALQRGMDPGFRQRGYSDVEAPMIDMIFAVDDTLEFHAANVAANPDHYSFKTFRNRHHTVRLYFNAIRPARSHTRIGTHARTRRRVQSPPRTFTSIRWCLCRGSG